MSCCEATWRMSSLSTASPESYESASVLLSLAGLREAGHCIQEKPKPPLWVVAGRLQGYDRRKANEEGGSRGWEF